MDVEGLEVFETFLQMVDQNLVMK